MDIIPYVQCLENHQIFPMFYLGFRNLIYPEQFEKRRKWDFRIKDGPGGFCAVEDGKIIGFVGIMHVPTRAIDGPEMVGGIFVAVTDPSAGRRGICTALMEEAHTYFRGLGYRLCFLSTMRTNIAHEFYTKNGYLEVEALNKFPSVFKRVNLSKKMKLGDKRIRCPSEEHVARTFSEFTADMTGFVIRTMDFLAFQEWKGEFDPVVSVANDGGYALVNDHHGPLEIAEITGLDFETQDQLLEILEMRAKGAIVDPWVTDTGLLEVYKKRNYITYKDHYVVVMAKSLEPGVTVENVYGNAFYMSKFEIF